MIYVTSITTVKNYKKKVCLSDGTDFVLYKKELYVYGLREDMEITDELYQRLVNEVFIPRAKSRAMHLLESMDRSESQLRAKLRESGYPDAAIDAAIAYVANFRYVDDERLARSYIRFHQESKSRMRVIQDLIKKGISRDVIDRCMEEEYHQSQEELIGILIAKRHYNRSIATKEEQAKMYRFLMQRGFSAEDIRKALSADWDISC